MKQPSRRVVGWRGIGDYPATAPQTWREYMRPVFAGERQHINRPVRRSGDQGGSRRHKGFNWRMPRAALAGRFASESPLDSPVRWLPAGVGSQVWFIPRNPEGRRSGGEAP